MMNEAPLDPQAKATAFQAALGHIGFLNEAQLVLSQNGFNSVYNFLINSRDQIKCVCKVIQLEDNDDPIPISMEQEQL
jgi:hypothetical protein